jgi:hypothetical protein
MKARLAILLLLLVSLTSCSYLTPSGRRAYAYRSYVRKASIVRTRRQRKKFHFHMPQMAIRQDSPTITSVSDSPQSVTAGPTLQVEGEQEPAPAEQPSPQN